MGSDKGRPYDYIIRHEFQSTLPAWGATKYNFGKDSYKAISIHAPRMGSDKEPRMLSDIIKISIHAPRMGSDKYKRITIYSAF